MTELQTLKIDPADYGCQDATVIAIKAHQLSGVSGGEPIIEFECDKASFELSMPSQGTIKEIFVKVGQTIIAETDIALIVCEGSTEQAPKKNCKQLAKLGQRYSVVSQCQSLNEAIEILNASTKVELASTSDAKSFAEVYFESTSSLNTYVNLELDSAIEWFTQELSNDAKMFWKCTLVDGSGDANQCVGYINLERVNRAPVINYYFVGLYVASPQLSWTCGNVLLHALTIYCLSEGIPQLFAFTKTENVPAANLLRRFGFEAVGESTDHNYGNSLVTIYSLDLKNGAI